MEYKFLKTKIDQRGVGFITLNRPEIHNAFNDELIKELTDVFTHYDTDPKVRLVLLSGEGKSFCAGADLNWMSSMVDYTMEENVEDSRHLARMFEVMDEFTKPIIGKVNGHALGGGVGVVAVCDYTITHEKAKFGFTEVRLGLIPAVISPFCIRKIGESNARAWFLSGEMFKGAKAQQMGLIHEVTTLEDYDQRVNEVIESHLKAGPEAAIAAKRLINHVHMIENKEEMQNFTCLEIAKKRISDEGQEGMKALLEKRQANWNKL